MAVENTPIDVNEDVSAPEAEDNLDTFSDLFYGRKEEAVVEEDTTVAEEPEDTTTEDENEGVEDTSEDSEDTEEDVAEEEPVKPQKRPSAKERIAELTAEKYAERRLREEETAQLKAKIAELETKTEKKAPEEIASPSSGDLPDAPDPDAVDDKGEYIYPLGETDPLYIKDQIAYAVKIATQEAEQKVQEKLEQERITKEEATRANAWEEKLHKSEEGLEDLRPTIAKLDGEFNNLEPEFGVYLAQTIMDMDYGPEVLYYLANNIDEARKITGMGARQATLALGRIEARVESALKPTKPTKPVQTKAPEPPAVTRGNSGAMPIAPDTDKLDDFERLFFNKK